MATKQAAMRVAAKFGMVMDEMHSNKIGSCSTVIFDHPSHSLSGECRGITVSGYQSMASAYAEAIERMEAECVDMEECTDPDCEYHGAE
ncbi:MAG: hypothetical protein WC284_06390 [Candidimonas sp.]